MAVPVSEKMAAWWRLQLGMIPSLIAVCTAAIGISTVLADSHNDERYVQKDDGDKVAENVEQVQRSVTEIQKTQAVNSTKVENIEANLKALSTQQDTIEAKIDRLIERR
jgi:septal ring factor EnvC (AmiA/AmiB activator)